MNEAFVFSISGQIMWFWTGIMLLIMVKEIHNYSFGETIKSILTTLFTMAMFLLIGYILYILFNQLYEFVLAIIQEAGLRG
jgi:accessory gene regulator protein AgrB